jgi:putative ABC transport system permease protein
MISRIHEAPEPFMVFPFAQLPVNEVTFLVETAGRSETLLKTVKKEMRSANPNLALMMSSTWRQQLHDAMYANWLPAVLSAVIGLMGMILAAAGLFGVVLHGVNRQMRATGVRLALGAQASQIMGLVLRRGLLLAGSGALIGTAVSLAAGRLIASLLYGVEPHDPLVMGLSIAVVLTMAVAASFYPAWKATRVDPAMVLRAE